MSASPAFPLLILGAGGHGRVVADAALAQGWTQLRATDRDARRHGETLLAGIAVQSLEDAVAQSASVHVAIGSATAREREAQATGLPLATVIHPRAAVSPYAEVGAGTFVAAQAVLAPGTRVGTGVIVNHGAVIDHDAQVGDFSHVAPLAALGGGAQVGRRVLVGAGAKVLPGVRIADDVVVGAGAVVIGDIATAGVYAGVPARRVR